MTFCLTQRHSLCYFDHNNSALLQGAASLSKMAKSSFERHQNFNDVWCHRHQSLSMTIFVIVIIICRHRHFFIIFPLIVVQNDDDARHYGSLVMPRRYVINDDLRRHFSSIFSNPLMTPPLDLNSEQVKVWYSNIFLFQMFIIQIPLYYGNFFSFL